MPLFRSAVEDLKTIKQIDRILQIWKEREIFGKDFIDKLQSFRPKGLRSESQSDEPNDGTLVSPNKKRIRSTSDSGDSIFISTLFNPTGIHCQYYRLHQCYYSYFTSPSH